MSETVRDYWLRRVREADDDKALRWIEHQLANGWAPQVRDEIEALVTAKRSAITAPQHPA